MMDFLGVGIKLEYVLGTYLHSLTNFIFGVSSILLLKNTIRDGLVRWSIGAEIKANSAQLKLDFCLSLAKNSIGIGM